MYLVFLLSNQVNAMGLREVCPEGPNADKKFLHSA